MVFKYVHMILSTNFDLEPVIEHYQKTYPGTDLHNYQIVYKATGEFHPDSISYFIVYEYRAAGNGQPNFGEFLTSYCTVHRLAVNGLLGGQHFPDISPAVKKISGQK
jgi:hypothetical protein